MLEIFVPFCGTAVLNIGLQKLTDPENDYFNTLYITTGQHFIQPINNLFFTMLQTILTFIWLLIMELKSYRPIDYIESHMKSIKTRGMSASNCRITRNKLGQADDGYRQIDTDSKELQ